MAITGACHVESAAGSGAASVVVTCQRMGESRGIRRRKWSRIVAVIVACQGAQIHRLKFGSGRSPAPVGVRAESFLRLGSWVEPGSRGSPGGVISELKSRAEPGSRKSPGGIPCNQN